MTIRFRCQVCNKKLAEYTKLYSWHKINNFIDLLYSEEDITEETHAELSNAIQDFKEFAYEDTELEKELYEAYEKIKELEEKLKGFKELQECNKPYGN